MSDSIESLEASWNINENFERCGHVSGIYAIKSEKKMMDMLRDLSKNFPDNEDINRFVRAFENNTAIYNTPEEGGFFVYKNKFSNEFRIAIPDVGLNIEEGFKHHISNLDMHELDTLIDLCQKRKKEKLEEDLQPVLVLLYEGDLVRAFMPYERKLAEEELEKMILSDLKRRRECGYNITHVDAKIEERRVRMSDWECYFGPQN